MNRRLLKVSLAVMIIALSLSAFAVYDADEGDAGVGDTFTINGLTYTVLDGGVNVSVKNASTTSTSSIVVIPSVVNDGVNDYYVTEVAENGFKDNVIIQSVQIPTTVTRIGDHAFEGCVMLKSVADYDTGYFPAGYTKLQYIQSTNVHYIDLGIKPSQLDDISITYSFNGNHHGSLIGASTSSLFNYVGIYSTFSVGSSIGYGENWGNGSGQWKTFSTITDTKVHTITIDLSNVPMFYLDGSLKATQTSYQTISTENLFLNRTILSGWYVQANFYSVVLSNGDTVLGNYVPCIRNDDSKVGLFNTITGEFRQSSGTGSFTAGPAISTNNNSIITLSHVTTIGDYAFNGVSGMGTVYLPEVTSIGSHAFSGFDDIEAITGTEEDLRQDVPAGYIKLEYIKSSGTQYIDTGIRPTLSSTRIVFDGYEASNYSLFGANAGIFGMTGSNGNIRADYNNQTYNTSVSIVDRHLWEMDKNLVIVDGAVVKTFTLSSLQTSLDLLLFARNSASGADDAGSCICYSVKIWDGNTLARNFIPCVSPTGVIGMYDTVTDQFFGNSGTGSFIAGPSVDSGTMYVPKLTSVGDYAFSDCTSLVYAKLDKVTSTGSHLFDGCDKLMFIGLDSLVDVGEGTFMGSGVEVVSTEEKYKASDYHPVLHRLPEGYTELEYILSTGTQYIDTGKRVNALYNIKYVGTINNDDSQMPFGSSDTGVNVGIWGGSDKNLHYWYYMASTTPGLACNQSINTVEFRLEGKIILNGIEYAIQNQQSVTPTESGKIYLFGCYETDTRANWFLTGVVSYFELSDDQNNVVLALVPCIYHSGQSDEAIGMFDLATNTFYSNSGTGSFIAGPNASNIPENVTVYLPLAKTIGDSAFEGCTELYLANLNNVTSIGDSAFKGCSKIDGISETYASHRLLPYGYTELEYIESTGIQYINTGIKPVDTTTTEIKFQYSSMSEQLNNNPTIFGALRTNGADYYGLAIAKSSMKWMMWYGTGGSPWVMFPGADTNVHTVLLMNKSLYFDGSSTPSATSTLSTTSNTDMLIFATFYGSNVSYHATGKVFYTKIWENGTLVRDMVPCINDSTKEAGLFDLVGCVFYGNAGTGSFIKGPSVFSSIYAPSLQTIGDSAFEGVTSLEAVSLPSLTTLGESAFKGCTSLSDVDLSSLKTAGSSAFEGDASLKTMELASLTSMGSSLFKGCTLLETVDLSSMTYLADYTFKGCTKLKNAKLDKVTSVGESSFENCSSIKNVGERNLLLTAQLPAGYTAVQYIESSGAQYIDTGYKPSTSDEFVVSFVHLDDENGVVFGCGTSGAGRFWLIAHQKGEIDYVYASEYKTSGIQVLKNQEYAVTLKNGTITINDTTQSFSGVRSSTAPNSLYLFKWHNSANPYPFVGRISAMSIYTNGVLAHDYIPCINENDVVGMYDCVSGQFFGNSGTGSFIPGPEKSCVYVPMLVSVGDCAFKGCTNLTTVEGKSITATSDYSFSECPKLENVSLSSTGNVDIGEHTFDSSAKQTANGFNLSGKIVEIRSGAFMDSKLCSINDTSGKIKLNDINPEGLADHSFEDMTGITEFNSSTLTMIKNGTFKGSSVQTVTATNVTSVYGSAFEGCANLGSVTLATGNNCSLVETDCFKNAGTSGAGLVIVAKLTSTGGGYAFQGAKIKSIGMSSGLASGYVQLDYLVTLAEGTFKGCTGLTSFSSTSSNFTEIGAYAFMDSGLVNFTASSVTNVVDGAFYNCDSISQVTLPLTGKVTLGIEVFRDSKPVGGFQVVGNIETIGDGAFRECTVNTISNGATDADVDLTDLVNIGSYAFYGSSNITGVIAPKCVVVGDHAFDTSTNLNYFDTSPTIDSASHTGLLRMLNGFDIGEYAFAKTSFTRIELDGPVSPSAMTIKKGAFSGISGITEVFIPEKVTAINASVFEGCIGLTKIHIPFSVTTVDTTAFCNTALSTVLNLYFVSDSNNISFTCSDTSKKPTSTVKLYSKWDNVTTANLIKNTLGTYQLNQVARASVQVLYQADSTVEQLYALDGVDFKLPYTLVSGSRIGSDTFGIAKSDGAQGLTITTSFLSVEADSGETFTAYLTKDTKTSYDTVVLWAKGRVPASDWNDTFTLKVDNTKRTVPEADPHQLTVDGVTYTLSIDGGWPAYESISYHYGDIISYPIVSSSSSSSQVLYNFNYVSSASKVSYADTGSVTSRAVFADSEYTVEDRPMPITVTWVCNGINVRVDDSVEYKTYIDSFTPTNIPDGKAFSHWKVTSGTVYGDVVEFGGDKEKQSTQAGRTALVITAQFKTIGYKVNIYDSNGDLMGSTFEPFGEYTVTKQSSNNLVIQWTGESPKYSAVPTFDFGYTFSKYVYGDYIDAEHVDPQDRGTTSDLPSPAAFTRNVNIYVEKTGQLYTVNYITAYGSETGPSTITLDGVKHSLPYEEEYYFLGVSSKTVVVGDETNLVYTGYKVGDNQYQGNVVLEQKTFSSGTYVTITLMYGDMSYKVGYSFEDDAANYVEYNSRYIVGNTVTISDSIRSLISTKYGYELSTAVGTPVKWTYSYGGTDYYISGLNFIFTQQMKELAESNTAHPNTLVLKAVWTPAKITVQYTTGTEGDWVEFLSTKYPSTTKNWSATVTSGQADFDTTGRCSDKILIGTALIPSLQNVAWPGFTFNGEWEVHKKNGDTVKFDSVSGLIIESATKLQQYDMDSNPGDSVYIIYVTPVFKNISYGVNYDLEGKGIAKDVSKYKIGDRITLLTKNEFTYDYPDHTFSAWNLNDVQMGQYLDVTQESVSEAVNDVFNFTVVWSQTEYLIKFDLNGGIGTIPDPIGPALPSASITNFPSYQGYTMDGYKCVGWSVGGKVLTKTPSHVSDLTYGSDSKGEILVKLAWTPNSYNVVCNTDGGNITSKYLVGYYDMDLAVPVPSKPGYAFVGWKSKDVAEGAQYKLGDNYYSWTKEAGQEYTTVADSEHFKNLALAGGTANLLAVWAPVEYTIEYNLSDGSGVKPEPLLISVDEQFTDIETDLSKFTMSGYEPIGWTINGTDLIQPTTTFTSSMARYADNNKVINMYLKWSAARYTITLQEDNGTTDKTKEAFYGVSVNVGVPSKAGYEFIGWIAVDPTKLNQSSSMCSPDNVAWYGWKGERTTCQYFMSLTNIAGTEIFLKAQWSKDQYVFTFDLAGGSGEIPDDITATVGDAVTTLPELSGITKTGYYPMGWTIDGDNVITNGDIFTSTMAMYANSSRIVSVAVKWAPISYVLDIYDGRTTSQLTVNFGDSINLGKPVKSGYVFTGWLAESSIWNKAMYSSDGQSWYIWDGTVTTYTYFKNLATEAGSSVSLSAQHTLEQYALSFDINGGTGESPSDVLLQIGDKITELPSTKGITKAGYEPRGWTIDGNSVLTENTVFTSTLARYADENRTVKVSLIWDPIQYYISYTDASQTYTQQIYFDDSLNIGIPVNEGYVFAGWMHTEGQLANTAMSSRDGEAWVLWDGTPNASVYYKNLSVTKGDTVGLTAQWKSDSFTIKYNANGGIGQVPVDTNIYTLDSSVQLVKDVSFTRAGYDFLGWSYDRNATSPVEINTFSLDYVAMTDEYNQLTLYAVWSIGYYKVTVDIGTSEASFIPLGWTNDGPGQYSKKFENGYSIKEVLVEWDGVSLTMEGKAFSGWSYGGTKVLSDMTITAVFHETSIIYILILAGVIVAIAVGLFILTRFERR